MFLFQWQASYVFIFLSSKRFLYRAFKNISIWTPDRWVNTVLSCTQPCTWHVAVEFLDIFKKEDTDTRNMKLFQHLYSVLFPFTLTLLRMKNTIMPLYCAAFIVDCFKTVIIHFLLNLSSFTQGHTLLCIGIPQLFKTQAWLSLWLLTWPKMW